MSSDSSSQSKGQGDQIQKLKTVIDSSSCESGEPNANKNFNVSQQSIKSIPKQDIEQLGSAEFKSSVTMDMYNKGIIFHYRYIMHYSLITYVLGIFIINVLLSYCY